MKEFTRKNNCNAISGYESVLNVLTTEMNELINPIFDGVSNLKTRYDYSCISPSEISEQNDKYLIKLEIPGVDKEKVDITLKEDCKLIVEGEKEKTQTADNEKMRFTEMSYGKFRREFKLSKTCDATNIKAEYNKGILTILIPKKEEDKPTIVKIDVT